MNPQWLTWAQELAAIAQSGLTYTTNPFERERYEQVRHVAAEIVANHTGLPVAQVQAVYDAQAGYATPKVDVRGVVFNAAGQILLVRERADGFWTLPGGWADVNDSPADATEREIREESGYQARAVKLLALYDRNKHGHPPYIFHIYKVFFRCELTGGEPATSVETTEVGWFGERSLPDLSIPRVTPEEMARFFAHYRHPEWPTDYD